MRQNPSNPTVAASELACDPDPVALLTEAAREAAGLDATIHDFQAGSVARVLALQPLRERLASLPRPRVLEALAGLPENTRAVLVAHFGENLGNLDTRVAPPSEPHVPTWEDVRRAAADTVGLAVDLGDPIGNLDARTCRALRDLNAGILEAREARERGAAPLSLVARLLAMTATVRETLTGFLEELGGVEACGREALDYVDAIEAHATGQGA